MLYLYWKYQKEYPLAAKGRLMEFVSEKMHLTPAYAGRVVNELMKSKEFREGVERMQHAEDY